MYMNRLLMEGENLVLGKRRVLTELQTEQLQSDKKSFDELDEMDERDQDLDFKPNKFDQEVQVEQKQEYIIEIIKKHIIDLICRISPRSREKTENHFLTIKGEKLLNYSLRGI